MKIYTLEIPDDLRDVFELVQISDDGNVFVVYKGDRALMQINGSDIGDMLSIPVRAGRMLRLDTRAIGKDGR